MINNGNMAGRQNASNAKDSQVDWKHIWFRGPRTGSLSHGTGSRRGVLLPVWGFPWRPRGSVEGQAADAAAGVAAGVAAGELADGAGFSADLASRSIWLMPSWISSGQTVA